MTFLLNITTALHCEAKPIIAYYKLKKILDVPSPFPIFANHDKTIFLIITGVGKIKTAAATTLLHSLTGFHDHACFLNIGIAGSTEFNLGQAVVANKITEHATQRSWYPFISPLKKQLQTTLITHDAPQIEYPQQGMLDMEGSAFFQTASHFITQEQIQIMKIISDGSAETQKNINEKVVQEIIFQNIANIENVSQYLIELSKKEYSLQDEPNFFAPFKEKWHFTHTQVLLLKEQLRRWCVQHKDQDPYLFCENEKSADAVIKKITRELTCKQFI